MIKINIDWKKWNEIQTLHKNYVIEKSNKRFENIIHEYELKNKLLNMYSKNKRKYLNEVEKLFKKSLNDLLNGIPQSDIEKHIIDYINECKIKKRFNNDNEKTFIKLLKQSLVEMKNTKSEYKLFKYLQKEGLVKLALLNKEDIVNFPDSLWYNKELRKLMNISLKLKYIKLLKYYKKTTIKSLGLNNINGFLLKFENDIKRFNFQYIVKGHKSYTSIKYKRNFDDVVDKYIKSLENEINPIIKKIEDLFNYDDFVRGYNEWGAYEFVDKLNIGVCPYCNRSFTTTYRSEHGRTRPELDHFYIKSIYPYLALTLYNLIPSCHICNSNLKGDKDFVDYKPIYPYIEEFGEEVNFKTDFYTEKDLIMIENDKQIKEIQRYDISYLSGNSFNFKIELEIKNPHSEKGKKIKNSKDTFKLEELYNFHKDYIKELIKKAIIYNESRIKELFTQHKDLFSSREEVLQMVVSNYINNEDLGKRPLAKLTKDICEELGLK